MNLQDYGTTVDKMFDRVRDHTPQHVNRKIDLETQGRLAALQDASHDELVYRLSQLDREWDIDRALMANFTVVGGMSYLLGLFKHRAWLYFFSAQLGFLLLHATVGWCPPSSAFRRLGTRTAREIDAERHLIRSLLDERKPAKAELAA